MARSRLKNPIILSILASILTLGIKFAAYLVTDSVGLLSDAVESVVNILASLTALLSLWYAAQPIDSNHTYGHEKIEFFSSGLEGVLILVAAAGIAWYAVRRLIAPEPLYALPVGVAAALAASLINIFVAQLLFRAGRASGSIVVQAHGELLMADFWTSAAVLLGLAAVSLTNRQVFDPLIALLVAGKIVWTGFQLLHTSFNGLMDHALPLSEQTAVRAAIESQLELGMDYHALRTRLAGSRRFADFHMLVPGTLCVRDAHEVANRIEDAVRQALPGIEVAIHIEPIEERAAWEDSALVAIEQAEREKNDKSSEQIQK